jgi:hypothetical protein
MKTQPAPPTLIRNPKRTGELSEAAFMLKARTLGFGIAKPWGDSERYDFILYSGPRLWRVQLKCTEVLRARGYDIQPIYSVYGKGKVTYTAKDIDVLVAHIVPLGVWYILPIEVFRTPPASASIPTSPAKTRAGNNTAKPGTSSPAPSPNVDASVHARVTKNPPDRTRKTIPPGGSTLQL